VGFAISWIALKGANRKSVLDRLALNETAERSDEPEADILAAELRGGWLLILHNRRCDFADGLPLRELSRLAPVVTCAVEEHVMYSAASQWSGGERRWQVIHDSEQGLTHLAVDGTPPDSLKAFQSDALAQLQAEGGEESRVDFVFDVPVKLAEELVEFKHDRYPPADAPDGYITLIAAPRRSFLFSLFRKR